VEKKASPGDAQVSGAESAQRSGDSVEGTDDKDKSPPISGGIFLNLLVCYLLYFVMRMTPIACAFQIVATLTLTRIPCIHM